MLEENTLPPETTEEMGRLVSIAQGSDPLPRVRFNAPEKPEQEPSHRKFAKVTIKYNRKDLQKRLDLEEWIDTRLQELYQYQLQEETEATSLPEPEIDIEDLLEVSDEEQKSKLEKILHECSRPTEENQINILINIKVEVQQITPKHFKMQTISISPKFFADFISELLDRLRDLRKTVSPLKKRLTVTKPIMQET